MRPNLAGFLVARLTLLRVSIEDVVIVTSSLGPDPEEASVVFETNFRVGNGSGECATAGILSGHSREPAQAHDQREDVIELT